MIRDNHKKCINANLHIGRIIDRIQNKKNESFWTANISKISLSQIGQITG